MSKEKRLLDEERDKNKHLMNIVYEAKRGAGYILDQMKNKKKYCKEKDFNWSNSNEQILKAAEEILRIAEIDRQQFLQEQVDKINNQRQLQFY